MQSERLVQYCTYLSHHSSSHVDQRRAFHCCEVLFAVPLYPDQSSSGDGFGRNVAVGCVGDFGLSASSEGRRKRGL